MKYLLFLILPIWPDWNAIYQALRHDTTMTGEGSDASPLKVDTTLVSTRAYANNIDAVKMFTNTSDATSHTVTMDGYSFKLIEGTNISLATLGTSDNGTVTISATGASLSDGDKGDVTVASGVIDIDAGVIGDNELGAGINTDQLADGTVSSTEFQYINSLSSNAQTQLTARAVLAGASGGQTLIGGTGTTDDLVLQSTSGVGATGALIQAKVGNNGGTTAWTVLNTGVMGMGSITSPVSGSLELPGSTSNSSLKAGTFELQSYAVNNAWLGDNVYFNGSAFVARSNGFAAMNYFYNGAWHVRVAASSLTAGGTFLPKIPFVVNRNKSIAMGGDVSAGTGLTGSYMVIDSIGKVGIGTTTPAYNLDIVGSLHATQTNTAGFTMANMSNTSYAIGDFIGGNYGINIAANDATSSYYLLNIVSGATVSSTSFSGGTSRLRLLNNGKLGIGTTAPDKLLELNLGTSDALRLTYDDANGSAANYMDATISSTGSPTFNATGTTPTFTFSDPVLFDGYARLKAYTVATLPTGVTGAMAYVTDATAPTYLGALTGGGAVTCPVFYNGTAWVSH